MTTAYNKPNDTVDWGEDYDYAGFEWFKDPPPRPEVCNHYMPYIACLPVSKG